MHVCAASTGNVVGLCGTSRHNESTRRLSTLCAAMGDKDERGSGSGDGVQKRICGLVHGLTIGLTANGLWTINLHTHKVFSPTRNCMPSHPLSQ